VTAGPSSESRNLPRDAGSHLFLHATGPTVSRAVALHVLKMAPCALQNNVRAMRPAKYEQEAMFAFRVLLFHRHASSAVELKPH